MEENKSHLRADYKRELYDALVKSYNTDKDLFDTYSEVFTLKRSRDDKDKDQDPSAGSDRGTKRRKSSKEAKSSKDPRSKEMQQNQEFDMGNNDEQPDDEAAPNDTAHAEKPPTSFDELMDTPIDFSAFVLNQLNITNLTQELLFGLAFNLLKGTCKSKSYPFDLREPLPLIPDHRGRQVIPHDYFINNDLEYLKGGSLSRQYSTSVTKTKDATYEVKWIEDMVPNIWSPVKVVYDKHAYWVTRLTIMKGYDYGHLDEIEVRREDQQLYTFKEGDFLRLRVQDIKDMLLLLFQQKLTNLTIDERYDLNVALRMFTDISVIERRGKDLQISQNRRDLPRDNPLDSVEVLRHDIKRSKSENKGIVPTEMELVLEQTQQGTSHEVSSDTYVITMKMEIHPVSTSNSTAV
ncbi:hypothetical protein Tco_1305968, partial [Tanacetum coccineum]